MTTNQQIDAYLAGGESVKGTSWTAFQMEHVTADVTITRDGDWYRCHIVRVYPTDFDGRGLA